MSPADLWTRPFAYTSSEGERFRPWDEPWFDDINAVIWEDGSRWDKVNGYTDGKSPGFIADLKEIFRAEAAGETWWCQTHNHRASCVHAGLHICPPESDYEPRGVPCKSVPTFAAGGKPKP